LSGSFHTVINSGTISGGAGGLAGRRYVTHAIAGTNGAGGAGIVGADLTIINSGTINGGYSGDGLVRASAIELSGLTNSLELRKGSNIGGNVVGSNAAGASNTLTLGGTDNDSFDTSQIGSAAQYRNFTHFQKTGTSTYTLTGTSNSVTPWSVLGGTLAISTDSNLGAAGGALALDGGTLQSIATLTTARAVTLGAAGGTVSTDASTTTTMSGVITGAGGLTKTGAGALSVSGANTYAGATHVGAGTLQADALNTLSASSAHTVDSGATLALSHDQTIGSLAGAGAVNLDSASLTTGGDATSTAFSGVMSGTGGLSKTGAGTLTLSGANTYSGGSTIQGGTLAISADNNLGAAGGALTLDGGTLQGTATLTTARAVTLGAAGGTVNTDASTTTTMSGVITGAGGLTKTGAGALSVTGVNTYAGATRVGAGTLQADALNTLSASSAHTVDSGATLALSHDQTIGSLAGAGAVNLDSANLTTGGDATSTTFSGVMSGTGELIKTGAGTLTLSGANTYSGTTHVDAGTLQADALNTLSASSAHTVDNGATLALSHDQTIGSLAGAGTVNLDSANLTTGGDATSTTFSGVMSGSGELIKTGAGTLTLSGANTYSGGSTLAQGRIDVAHNSALGTGSLALDQNATLGFAADDLNLANDITLTGVTGAVIDTGSHDETLSGLISGAGILSKVGSGSLNLSGANTYSGATQVNEGTLRAAAPHTFSAASAHNVANGATLDTGGFDQRVAALTNNGTVSLAGSATGSTLTVTGPYGGQNGVLRLGTALSDSTGVSDRLELNGPGAVASGSTQLQIVNLQGLGALTLGDGITVVSAVNGATTTAQTTKDAFSLAGGHVVAGAYEYNLYAADASGAGENWYLRSTLTTVPVTPVPPTQPSTPAVHIPTYRTEVPLLAALPEQLRQGNLAMLGNLHQRIGSNAVRGEPTAQGWGRVLGTKLKIGQSGTVSPSSDGNLEGFQIGSDLYADDDWHAGLYVGDLKGNMDVKGFARGIDNLSVGHNDLHSQYLGGYATWTGATGLYVDTVLQRGRHDDDAHSQGGKVSGKGDSWLASVEMGQPFALNSAWSVEPQVQLVQQHLDLDDAHIGSTQVRQDVDQGWMARLGARLEGDYATGAGRVQPYGRVNLYRAANGNDVTRFENAAASTAISSSTGYTSRELAGGATLKLNDRTDVYAEIGKQWAAGGDSDVSSAVQGSMGVRVKW
jgi:outer membrane autotransporter protein